MVRSSANPFTLWGVKRAMKELVGLWLGDRYHLSFPFAGIQWISFRLITSVELFLRYRKWRECLLGTQLMSGKVEGYVEWHSG